MKILRALAFYTSNISTKIFFIPFDLLLLVITHNKNYIKAGDL
jgi:hypothetical protein